MIHKNILIQKHKTVKIHSNRKFYKKPHLRLYNKQYYYFLFLELTVYNYYSLKITIKQFTKNIQY